ncbi:MAG: DNA polymerase Y family protein [Alphaproteobacteria bacterium]|nr:DNA polymerase Y family protein [Alphaproteobacteria bacterium]
MKRFVSLWFPFWPVERMRRACGEVLGEDGPLVLVASGGRGIEITALNRRAAAEGLWVGQALADARAMLPGLKSLPAETEKDTAALQALAHWCGRYGPQRNVYGDDGLWIDVTGVAHLFGGEAGLMADLVSRIEGFGITVRAGLADTFAAAYGLARFSPMAKGRCFAICETGSLREAVSSLPVEALRITPEAVLLLQRLGLRRVGQLYDIPRASLERRFRETRLGRTKKSAGGAGVRRAKHGRVFAAKGSLANKGELAARVLLRLDQALGEILEPLPPLAEPPVLSVRQSWTYPLISAEGIEAEVGGLAVRLTKKLEAQGLGARSVRLSLYRSDGRVIEIAAGTSMACRDSDHLMRLLAERFGSIDAGFGIDVAQLDAVLVEPMAGEQQRFNVGAGAGGDGGSRSGAQKALGELIDRLTSRLGADSVKVLEPRESYLPERADRLWPARAVGRHQRARAGEGTGGMDELDQGKRSLDGLPPRPFLLLAPPEPIRVKLEDGGAQGCGQPRSFVWRRVDQQVLRLEGPERVAPEWWREIGRSQRRPEGMRDYFRVEVKGGARYWIFQELGGEDLEAGGSREGWFLHGLYGGAG